MTTDYIIEMRDVSKSFPGVKALSGINLKVQRGEIHAICGENGAGKSTLIKILAGVHTKGSYEGDVLVNGEHIAFAGTAQAEEHGIICIHQELELIPELTVGENIFLGNYPVKNGLIRWNQIHHEARDLLERAGIAGRDLAALSEQKIINLGIGQQQLVEIAKAFARNARVLVLDEPTAALTVAEADNLLKIVLGMKERGVTCIYISHRLDEVMRIADTITVLRDGQRVGTEKNANLTKSDIIAKMVGRQLTNLFPTEDHERKDVVLEVEQVSVTDPESSREVVSDEWLEQTPIKLDHALEWRLRVSAQAKGCLGNPRFSAFGCCSNQQGHDDQVYRERNNVPPQQRDMAMVFENYALYPHLKVFDNIAMPLVARGLPSATKGRLGDSGIS